MKNDAVASSRLIWYSVLGLALVLGASFLFWRFYYPTQLGLERDAIQQSHQYVDAKKSLLLKLAEDYEASETDIAKYNANDPVKYKDVVKGMETQQAVLLARIRSEAKMIPAEQVPESLRKYLR
jgi:hypothetical protein